jgi:DNA-binding MarR family transcriptional regulator
MVHMTAAGAQMLERARAVANASVDDVLAALDARERETLRQLLRKAGGLSD